MPSSRVNHVPAIIGLIRQLQPASILDVGVGFGKWGHLFREYTDIVAAEHEPRRYEREHWQVRIDGLEGHAPYITPMHRYLYNEIHLGDMREVIHRLGRYDVIFMGDVIAPLRGRASRGCQLRDSRRCRPHGERCGRWRGRNVRRWSAAARVPCRVARSRR